VAVVATAGDRRDDDMRQLGRVAARYFDDVIIREDRHARGRPPGQTAQLIEEGVREGISQGARAGNVEVVLDEMEATRRAIDRSRPGDLVVLCVDYATEVYKELERRRSLAAPSVMRAGDGQEGWKGAGGDPDLIEIADEVGL
jgi:cyanophycin synthetase